MAALVLVLGFAMPADAALFNLGTFQVDDDPNAGDIPLAIPAGNYNYYTFSTDWTAVSGDPWSNEAIWAITDGPLSDPLTTFFADPGPAPNSLSSGDPVTLQWAGFLDVPITGPQNGFLLTLQTFTGSVAQWANTTLELTEQAVVAPTLDVDLGVIGTDADPININTFAADFDTELGLYDAGGLVLASNDDAGGTLQSELDFPNLPAGDYYLAMGGYNSVFGGFFGATPGTSSGNYGLSVAGIAVDGVLAADSLLWVGFSIVPEPASLALLALGGLAALRRRR
jgi:hypothetical protein